MNRLALTVAAVVSAGYAALRWIDREDCTWPNLTHLEDL